MIRMEVGLNSPVQALRSLDSAWQYQQTLSITSVRHGMSTLNCSLMKCLISLSYTTIPTPWTACMADAVAFLMLGSLWQASSMYWNSGPDLSSRWRLRVVLLGGSVLYLSLVLKRQIFEKKSSRLDCGLLFSSLCTYVLSTVWPPISENTCITPKLSLIFRPPQMTLTSSTPRCWR